MDIVDYIQAVEEERRKRLLSIINLIKQLYPEAIESLKFKMPTYESRQGWIAVANQKNYLSVYTCAEEHIATFKLAYPRIKTGKGCINFRDKDPIPLDQLQFVIKNAMSGVKDIH